MTAQEIRLVSYVLGLYLCFISWGYLQEKITSTEYVKFDDPTVIYRWKFPIVLNFFMALGGWIIASVAEFIVNPKSEHVTPLMAYVKPAASCALASPIGYAALDYINFPLMILTKSSKPVPVMLVGVLFYRQSYTWYKWLSVLLICGGIVLFSAFKSKSGPAHDKTLIDEITGIVLVTINLFLDGYTSNQQDFLFSKYNTPSETMMKNVNFLQIFYLLGYLLFTYWLWGSASELIGGVELIEKNFNIRSDIAAFCFCASFGQLLIFALMKEFGSLVWITVSKCSKFYSTASFLTADSHVRIGEHNKEAVHRHVLSVHVQPPR